jgi:hypothetical protein
MRLHCDVLPAASVTAETAREMWRLFDRYYTGVGPERFEADFRAKDKVFVIREGKRVVGFNSLKIVSVDGLRVMYAGDMLIASEVRGLASAVFFRAWASALWKKCDWWCALASGPRTFRIPYVMFNRVTPNDADDETEEEMALRHRLALREYGAAYDPRTGVVRLAEAYIQKGADAEVREDYPLDAFFRNRNPGWMRGDELVSLVNLHPDNWSRRARRLLKEPRG